MRPILLAFTFLLLVQTSECILVSCSAEERRVHVAVNLPLSGELAVFGSPIQRGFSMAAEEIRGLSKPVELDIDWQDNQGKATQAATIATGQLGESCDIFVSGLKPQTLAVADRIARERKPHFIWAWDTRIDQIAPNTFRTWLNFGLEAGIIKSYAERIRPNRVAIVYVQIPGNTETHYREVVAPALRAGGAAEVIIESYSLDEVDFRSIALKLKKSNSDLFIINGFPHQLTGLIRAFRQLEMLQSGNTFASMDILDAASTLSPVELEGVVTAAPRFLMDSAAYSAWSKKYQSKFGEAPSYHAAFSYDQAYMIYDAAQRLPMHVDTSEWRNALLTTNRDGITGKLHFDEHGSLEVEAVAATFKGGKLMEVGIKKTPENKKMDRTAASARAPSF